MAAKKKKVVRDSIEEALAALKKAEVQPLRVDPLGAKAAVNTGLKALVKFEPVLVRDFKGFDLKALHELPELCDRLRRAQRDVEQAGGAKNVLALVGAALSHRRALLAFAQSLAERGLVDAKALAKIERGSGQTDNLQDVLDLVTLLEPLKARVEAALERGVLDAARDATTRALSAQGSGSDDLSELTSRRDRLGTLIMQRHERLRAAMAAVTSMSEAMKRVPPLATGAAPASPPTDAPKS